jgi:hypothetical protein
MIDQKQVRPTVAEKYPRMSLCHITLRCAADAGIARLS